MDDMRRMTSLTEYKNYLDQSGPLNRYKLRLIDMLMREAPPVPKPFFRLRQKIKTPEKLNQCLPGFSVTAGDIVDFIIDARLRMPDGSLNMRETVNCPKTGFNMRMRAAIHAVDHYEDDTVRDVYIAEQKTPMFQYYKARFPDLVGSEFLGDRVPLGQNDADGLRNEDGTCLTFEDDSFDVVMSFEVLEHIPDYIAALTETRRVMRPGGRFYFTAPFNPQSQEHLIRAKIENGEIVHILEPEMHGDPVNEEGILCFQHFGWDIVPELYAAGFKTVEALVFDQVEYGYYTQRPIMVFRAVA